MNLKQLFRFLLFTCFLFSGCTAAPQPVPSTQAASTAPDSTVTTRSAADAPSPSPTLAPTATSQPTPTIIPTVASSPTPQAPIQVEHVQDGTVVLAIARHTQSELWMYDAAGELLDIFHFNSSTPLRAQWTQDCHWAVTVSGDEIWKVDPQGNLVSKYLAAGGGQVEGLVNPALSPSAQWISAARWSGTPSAEAVSSLKPTTGSEFQDIVVFPVDQPQNAQQITEKGGAWMNGGTWAPNQDVLAFTDYDSQGAIHIYTWDPVEGKKKQLTRFENIGWKASPVKWSPDGTWLAVVVSPDFQTVPLNSELWAASTQGGSHRIFLGILEPYWPDWLAQPPGMIFVKATHDDQEYYGDWVSMPGAKLEHELTDASSAPEGIFANGFFLDSFPVPDSSLVAFIGSDGLIYQYNDEGREFTIWLDQEALRGIPLSPEDTEFSTVSAQDMQSCMP